ncbi:Endonuclease/exonuclease/phosphatase,Reverse transcriptase domain, partial [Cinara cedri]
LHEVTNINGLNLIDFATSKGLVIKSTMFSHKKIHKGTWKSPDGNHTNQIDHVLVNDRFKNRITNVKTMRGADCDSDHYLVKVNIKARLKFTDEVCQKRFKSEIHKRSRELDIASIGSTNNMWRRVQDTIKETSAEVLGKPKNTKKPWFNERCEKALNQRKKFRNLYLNDPSHKENKTKYNKIRKDASRIFKYEKRVYTKNILEEAGKYHNEHNIHQLYKKINTLKGGYKKYEMFLVKEDGTLITARSDLVERFKHLLNCNDPIETFTWTRIEPNLNECTTSSKQEVELQIRRLKNYKSPGEDGIQGGIMKMLDEVSLTHIHRLLTNIWEKEELPEGWNVAVIGLNTLRKRFWEIIKVVLDPTDQIFSLRQIIEKSWEFNKSICILFVDFKKAYDSVHRHSLINILKEFELPNKLIKLIEATLQNTEIKIKVASELSEPATVRTGLRQGNVLSPILFNLILEKIIRETNCNNRIVLRNSNINILAYADDIAMLVETEETVKQVCRKLIMMASKVGLEINDEKTEYIIFSRQVREYQQGQSMNVEGRVFKRVTYFKYLGHLLTQDNNLKMEVSARIQKDNKSFFGLGKVLSSRTLSTNLKIQICMTLKRLIVLYAAETWPLRKAEETRIKVFEKRIQRKIYGPCFDTNIGEWRKRHNKELEELFQRPKIDNEIKKRRLTWAGHAWRRVGSIVRTTIEENPVGKKPHGRLRLRWEDCVKRDAESIEPEIPWRVATENRDRWRKICLTVWSQ